MNVVVWCHAQYFSLKHGFCFNWRFLQNCVKNLDLEPVQAWKIFLSRLYNIVCWRKLVNRLYIIGKELSLRFSSWGPILCWKFVGGFHLNAVFLYWSLQNESKAARNSITMQSSSRNFGSASLTIMLSVCYCLASAHSMWSSLGNHTVGEALCWMRESSAVIGRSVWSSWRGKWNMACWILKKKILTVCL